MRDGEIYRVWTSITAQKALETGLQKRESFTPICWKDGCERLPTSLTSDQFFKIEFGPPDYYFRINGSNPLD